MSEHIDDNRLHTDLHYRFDYLSKFLHFTSDDITILNTFAPILCPRIPVIVDTAYRKLFSFDITKQYFLINKEGFEGFGLQTPGCLSLESTQMIFRKDVLSAYLKRVFTQGDWDDIFLQFLSQTGKIHTNQAGPASLNVDYIHINALLGYLEHLLLDVIWNAESLDEKTRRGTTMAINKLFWIQNDFFTMHSFTIRKEDSPPNETSKTKCKYCCI